MKISKVDSLEWFKFLSEIPGDNRDIFDEYSEVIRSTMRQIERSFIHEIQNTQKSIPKLKTMEERTYYVGDMKKFPKGCISCLFGDGLGGVRKTHTCNLTCKFCYYHDSMDQVDEIPEDMWDIGDTLYEEEDIDLLLSIQKKPSGIAYVYLEPFMEIEKYYPVVKKFSDAGIYQHMYTNGTLCTEENLRTLSESGLDELRFNLGASNCSDRVIEAMRTAKKYFKSVGIETPMTPEFYKSFLDKKEGILSTGIDFMNCAEFHIGPDNINNYSGENFYVYRNGYLSPLWSRRITYKFIQMAVAENWDMVVHDCSNHTKFAREINKAGKQGSPFGYHTYFSEFQRPILHLFIPILEDPGFEFLEEEPLPESLKLENCRESILEMVDENSSDDDVYPGFENYIDC